MRVRNILTGKIFEAERRTDVSASSYGQPVLCIKHEDGTTELVDDWAFEILGEKNARPVPFNFDPRD